MSEITILARLNTSEETRRYLWELMHGKYSLLVNELRYLVSQHPEFETWLKQGSVPKKAIEDICKKLKNDSRFQGLPDSFYSSAFLMILYNYESWIAMQHKLQCKLDGKKHWLSIVESDEELSKMDDLSQEIIIAKAREILAQTLAERSANDSDSNILQASNKPGKNQNNKDNKTLIDILFQAFETNQDILTRRAIIHLLRNHFQVNPTENEEKLALRLEKKRITIKLLEKQVKSRLPLPRDTTGQLFQQNLVSATNLPEHQDLTALLLLTIWTSIICTSKHQYSSKLAISFLLTIDIKTENINKRISQEFIAWKEDAPKRDAKLATAYKTLPYPIIFGGSDDIYWLAKEKLFSSTTLQLAEKTTNNESSNHSHQRLGKHKKQINSPQICLKFKGKGLSNHIFKLQCDRRQLPIFKQLLQDWLSFNALDKEDKFSMGLFALRSACLIWQKDEHQSNITKRRNKRHQKKTMHFCDEQSNENLAVSIEPQQDTPWNTHRLYLHCNIETRLLTAEGTEQVRQEKKEKHQKIQNNWQKKSELTPLTPNQQAAMKRNQSTLNRLDNPSPSRPSKPTYQGQPHIWMGVSFDFHKLLAVIVVNTHTGKVLKNYSVKDLLTNSLVQQPLLVINKEQNKLILKKTVFQLRLEKYRLVNRLKRYQIQNERQIGRKQTQDLRNLRKHPQNKPHTDQHKQTMYIKQHKWSHLTQYLCRLLAARIVKIALEWQASTIVLPEVKDLRDNIESEIRAKAERKYPDYEKAKKRYAKRYRANIHSWSYGELRDSISGCAAQNGILIRVERQPSHVDLQEKARGLVIAAVQNLPT